MNVRAPALALAIAAACASPKPNPAVLVREPIASRTWLSTLYRDHPLVGKIWDGKAGRLVDETTLSDALAGADLALLGEVHDNPDVHLLQARLVRKIVDAGRRPALALEMLTADLQPQLDAARAKTPREVENLAPVWAHGGWPDFDMYKPILAAGLEAGLPLVAANLPRDQVRALVKDGISAADPELRRRLERGPALSPEAIEELRAEMKVAHCGELPDAMMDPLILAQRARDATMSLRLAEASRNAGGILVAGKGHVRARDVPAWLAIDAPGRKIVAVAFVEVDPAAKAPADYAEEFGKGPFPYDYAIFVPATAREDPCAKLRERSRVRQQKDSPAPPAPPATPAAPRG